MTGDETRLTTRRTVLGAAGSAALVGLAGCVGEDDEDDNDDDGTGTTATSTVTLLAERAGGHDHGDDQEDHDDHDIHEDGLPDEDIGHACEHFEFDAPEDLTGGETADDAPEIRSTHQPFDVTFDGESGYVVFHTGEDDHDHDDGHDDHDDGHDGEMFVFFTDGGSVEITEGHTVYEEHGDVPACDPADMYVVAEPDHGDIVLELSP